VIVKYEFENTVQFLENCGLMRVPKIRNLPVKLAVETWTFLRLENGDSKNSKELKLKYVKEPEATVLYQTKAARFRLVYDTNPEPEHLEFDDDGNCHVAEVGEKQRSFYDVGVDSFLQITHVAKSESRCLHCLAFCTARLFCCSWCTDGSCEECNWWCCCSHLERKGTVRYVEGALKARWGPPHPADHGIKIHRVNIGDPKKEIKESGYAAVEANSTAENLVEAKDAKSHFPNAEKKSKGPSLPSTASRLSISTNLRMSSAVTQVEPIIVTQVEPMVDFPEHDDRDGGDPIDPPLCKVSPCPLI